MEVLMKSAGEVRVWKALLVAMVYLMSDPRPSDYCRHMTYSDPQALKPKLNCVVRYRQEVFGAYGIIRRVDGPMTEEICYEEYPRVSPDVCVPFSLREVNQMVLNKGNVAAVHRAASGAVEERKIPKTCQLQGDTPNPSCGKTDNLSNAEAISDSEKFGRQSESGNEGQSSDQFGPKPKNV